MRLLVGIVFLLILQACSQKKEKVHTVSDQIRVSLDTVLVDSGDEFLYLQDQLYSSSLSKDKNFLYNFNSQDYKVEKIDLNQLKLEKIIELEREGPDGVGSGFPRFSILTDDNLLFWTYHFYKIFDQNSLMVKDMQLDKISAEYLGNTEYYPRALFLPESDPNRVIVLINRWETGVQFLLDFDLSSKTFEKFDLPELQKTLDYKVDLLYDGTPAGGYGASMYWLQTDGEILISSSVFNEVVIFDIKIDSVYTKKWNTLLIGSKKTYLPPKSVERTSGQLKDIVRKMEEEISYRSLVWDEKNQRYFRFSDKKQFGEDLTEFGEYVTTGADVFLSIFDKEFNLIAEAKIPELTQSPNVHFVKDGKIWIFENINDELAFVIMDVEIL